MQAEFHNASSMYQRMSNVGASSATATVRVRLNIQMTRYDDGLSPTPRSCVCLSCRVASSSETGRVCMCVHSVLSSGRVIHGSDADAADGGCVIPSLPNRTP
jgi:hypothetical protein